MLNNVVPPKQVTKEEAMKRLTSAISGVPIDDLPDDMAELILLLAEHFETKKKKRR